MVRKNLIYSIYLSVVPIGKDKFSQFLDKSKEDSCVKYARARQQMEKMGMGHEEMIKCSGLNTLNELD